MNIKNICLVFFLAMGVVIFSGCGQSAAVVPTAPEPGLEPEPVPEEFVNVPPIEPAVTEEEPAAEITTPDETKAAQQLLEDFFDLARRNKFNEAAELIELAQSEWESFAVYSDGEDISDHARVIENHCLATGTCLRVKVIATERVDNETYRFNVQFLNSNGSIFELGPCCGAEEEDVAPQSEFDYDVKKIDGSFKVVTPPLYRP